jgi:type I restriction enzyme S subunit
MSIPDGWSKKSLGDLCSDISYGYTESASSIKIGPKFLRITDIVSGNVKWDSVPYCKISSENENKYRLQKGDILIARTGATTGYNYTIKENDPFYDSVFASYLIRYRIDSKKAYAFYVGQVLQSKTWMNFISGIIGGSAQPGANAQQFASFYIPLPPLPEQRAIAHILGTLDDKIELLRRMNRTLEEMARALFKSWFVDFDPVRAKMEGRWKRGASLPGMPADMWDKWPSRLVDSELGEIPEGWRVGTLGEVADNPRLGASEKTLKKDTHYIGLEHMPLKSISLYDWGNAGHLESNKFRFKKGDFLFGKLRPYFHKIGIAPVEGVCSTDILVIRPKSDFWYGFVIEQLSSNELIDYVTQASTGTKMPRTNWSDIENYQVVLPSTEIASSFNNLIRTLLDGMMNNIHSMKPLVQLRDTLLPKLVSGEVRVPEDMVKEYGEGE